jgi:hypothetical protein
MLVVVSADALQVSRLMLVVVSADALQVSRLMLDTPAHEGDERG